MSVGVTAHDAAAASPMLVQASQFDSKWCLVSHYFKMRPAEEGTRWVLTIRLTAKSLEQDLLMLDIGCIAWRRIHLYTVCLAQPSISHQCVNTFQTLDSNRRICGGVSYDRTRSCLRHSLAYMRCLGFNSYQDNDLFAEQNISNTWKILSRPVTHLFHCPIFKSLEYSSHCDSVYMEHRRMLHGFFVIVLPTTTATGQYLPHMEGFFCQE